MHQVKLPKPDELKLVLASARVSKIDVTTLKVQDLSRQMRRDLRLGKIDVTTLKVQDLLGR